MKLVKVQTASHWYDRDGNPVHEVPMKSDPTKMRDTNLSDARKLGLFPSVTNIIRMLAKPQLDAWKSEQMIMSALTIPVIEGETLDERARRAVRDADSQVDEARKRGTLAHRCIEDYLTGNGWNPHDDVAAIMEPFKGWFDTNVSEVYCTEETIVGEGYAGRVDLICRLHGSDAKTVIDFKTRKPSQGKLRCYDEDGMQLAAYAIAEYRRHDNEQCSTASVLINSETPSEPILSKWSNEDQKRYGEAFLNCFSLWKLLKNYSPV